MYRQDEKGKMTHKARLRKLAFGPKIVGREGKEHSNRSQGNYDVERYREKLLVIGCRFDRRAVPDKLKVI